MHHQPFEEWIFSEDPLTLDEERALQNHIQSCEHCRLLSKAWGAIEFQMKHAPIAAPEPGFTQRWEEKLIQERIRKQKRLTYFLLVVIAGSALALFLALGLQSLLSPGHLLVTSLDILMKLVSSINSVLRVAQALAHFLPPAVPIFLWISLTTTFSLLSLAWLVSLWKVKLFQRS